jgi:hypothetical protein
MKTMRTNTYLVCLIIQAIFSVVHCDAAMMRSPSFSLFSSSITTRNSPAAKPASASSIVSKAKLVRWTLRSVGRHAEVVLGLWTGWLGAVNWVACATGAIAVGVVVEVEEMRELEWRGWEI